MDLFWQWVLAVLLTESLVELSVDASLFEIPRVVVKSRWGGTEEAPNLLRLFIECGYCQSHWAAWALAFALGVRLPFECAWPWWVDPIVAGFVLARLSNFWHDVTMWLRYKIQG